jgi:G3E family GTPase
MFFTNNGCLCCTVRTDLIDITNRIFSMAKSQQLDAILVETTGMANPTPIMHTFLQYPCAAVARLDAVITMVDGKHILKVHSPLIFNCVCFDYTKMSCTIFAGVQVAVFSELAISICLNYFRTSIEAPQ